VIVVSERPSRWIFCSVSLIDLFKMGSVSVLTFRSSTADCKARDRSVVEFEAIPELGSQRR
jgi:hypothetical protein